MTTFLAELKRLAQAATPKGKAYTLFDLERAQDFGAAFTPEFVLVLIACVEAADAMRARQFEAHAATGKYHQPGCPFCEYDAARAQLGQT